MTFSKLKLLFAFTVALSSLAASAQSIKLALTGMQEVPVQSTTSVKNSLATTISSCSVNLRYEKSLGVWGNANSKK